MNPTSFIQENFLLQTRFAENLYHGYAESLPIIDYHNHLSPAQIVADHQFENITQAWLAGDHYKWRAMRILGVEEHFITGKASDSDKFLKWAETVPYTMKNPLYHWTHLELLRYFDIPYPLHSGTAEQCYRETGEKLGKPGFSAQGLLAGMKVETLCTTDDPADSLAHHLAGKESIRSFRMLPAFRPDKAYASLNSSSYSDYLDKLADTDGHALNTLTDLLDCLDRRIEFFHQAGCRLADHGLIRMPQFRKDGSDPEKSFLRARNGKRISAAESENLTHTILSHLCLKYAEKGWVQQFHLGALRNTNSRRLETLGADTGYDSIGDYPQAETLAAFLNELERQGGLAKTILYNLNPADNEVFATMAGNFAGDGVQGKIQWGSAWWYLDQKDGMEKQLNTLSNMGLLSCFIGMLTDSRSFLSFPRHEYFRRILCNLIGKDVAAGELPEDEKWLGKIVQDVCYNNARAYFPF